MSSHEDNKVIGLKNSVATKKVTRKELEEKNHIKYKYSHIYVPLFFKNTTPDISERISYSVEEELKKGILFIQDFKESYDADDSDNPYYDSPVEAWKACFNLLLIKYKRLEELYSKRPFKDSVNAFIKNTYKDYTKETFDKRVEQIKISNELLNDQEKINVFFKKEMKKFEEDEILNKEFNIVDSELDIGDSIYVLNFSDLLQRRKTKSPFSLEEYIIVDKNIRINFDYGGKKEILEDYTTTLYANPKNRKENVAYYDLSLYFKRNESEEILSMYVRSYYLEVFATKEAAIEYVRGLRKETDDFINQVENI